MSKSVLRTAGLCFVLSFVLLLSGAVGSALAEEGDGEFGVLIGFLLPDENLVGQHRSLGDAELAYGLRGGYHFKPSWAWFADVYRAEISPLRRSGSASTWALRTGLEAFLSPEDRRNRWFVAGGPGWMNVDLSGGGGFDRLFASLGVGQRRDVGDNDAIRWEIRADRTLSNDGLDGDDITRGLLVVSYAWGLGRTADADGDEVRDRRDSCPDTPHGAVVDERGCPVDSDHDGVFDGIDECAGTAKMWLVDRQGCPVDSDGDGIFDGEDECSDTPAGATIDANGCPTDGDGDGVFDGIDRCTGTTKGVRVDDAGCPKDSDGDGVFDGLDQCPNTPTGAEVKDDGCEKVAALFQDESRKLVLEGVHFATDSAELSDESRSILDRVALSLADWPEVKIEVGGHTDSDGSESYNQRLSARRAESVREYLISKGISGERVTARGYGESRPIEKDESKGAKAKNRRVEIKRID